MNVVWRPCAVEDRRRIVGHIANGNPQAAIDFDDALRFKIQRLLDHPLLYRTGRLSGTREMVVHPHYVVVYRIGSDNIEILRIRHTARRQRH